ncbi:MULTISPECIES: DUF6296 family protein [unclassified Streptomyces]|uniref:DUF6296 family protein n=1 Tax=unclassified Streptomyces TaxID=2593676 RepID=UPI0006AE3FEB|nr:MULTISPECIES: DUF6296 family protein [unclassified Streptomyces]KOX17583.1 hypothetical protein ADL06_32095 [Streptomyces sp. NRRL F-6491]KOX52248.1 hypothetical protein ADL08_02405 [Streptomyces sp. NRRL F-6492]
MSISRYELVFTDVTGATQDVVVVERTLYKGSGGHPIYTDPTGIIRAEISDRGEVRVMPSGGHQEPAHAVRARAVPEGDAEDPAGSGSSPPSA